MEPNKRKIRRSRIRKSKNVGFRRKPQPGVEEGFYDKNNPIQRSRDRRPTKGILKKTI